MNLHLPTPTLLNTDAPNSRQRGLIGPRPSSCRFKRRQGTCQVSNCLGALPEGRCEKAQGFSCVKRPQRAERTLTYFPSEGALSTRVCFLHARVHQNEFNSWPSLPFTLPLVLEAFEIDFFFFCKFEIVTTYLLAAVNTEAPLQKCLGDL